MLPSTSFNVSQDLLFTFVKFGAVTTDSPQNLFIFVVYTSQKSVMIWVCDTYSYMYFEICILNFENIVNLPQNIPNFNLVMWYIFSTYFEHLNLNLIQVYVRIWLIHTKNLLSPKNNAVLSPNLKVIFKTDYGGSGRGTQHYKKH